MSPIVLRAAFFLSGVACAVAVGSLLYLVVSFLVMRRHTPARTLGRTLRSMLAEAIAIAVTQPVLPLFYLVGRRMGGPREGRPVVFVHGYFQNRVDFLYLAAAMRRARVGPLYGFNYDWTRSIPAVAARLAAFVERVCRETGQPRVALIAHSLGGVVCLEYLATPEGRGRVDRCITIASPHGGVVWSAGLIGHGSRQLHHASEYMIASGKRELPLRVVSIFSTHDNIVHPSSTSELALRGGDDRVVDDVGHLGILFSRKVADLAIKALG